jgi:cyclic pyranopterin phosphate synthase
MGRRLTHVDDSGRVRMVDISSKSNTLRTALARGSVILKPETLSLIMRGAISKGNVFNTARVAGILAAKRVDELIPLCHPLNLTDVSVDFDSQVKHGRARIDIEVRATLVGKTGVEMEALAAVAVAALTIYDMCKAVDRGMRISDIRLVKKSKRSKG